MSFASASIPVDATYAPTGGTATGLLVNSQSGSSASYLVNDSAIYPLRRKVNASVTEPRIKADAPSGYTQRRARLNLQVPIGISVGGSTVYTTNQMTCELSADILAGASDITTLKSLMISMINDTDFTSFWATGALG